MTTNAGSVLKDRAAFSNAWIFHRRLLLVRDPRRKLFRRIRINAQQHQGVLGPAVLRTLPQVQPGASGSIHRVFSRFGITSTLPASRGTQKL